MQNITNKKTFAFKTAYGRTFIIAFVVGEDERIRVKSFGERIFPSKYFIDCDSVNKVTCWLMNRGNTYLKRLPVVSGSEYNEESIKAMLASLRALKV